MARQQGEAVERGRRPVRDPARLLDEAAALLTLTSAIFVLVSFVGYHLASAAPSLAGRVGYGLADAILQALGLAAYFIPIFMLAASVALFRQTGDVSVVRSIGAAVVLLCGAVLLALFSPGPAERSVTLAGGWVGGFLAELMEQAFGPVGSAMIAGAVLVLSLVVVTRLSAAGLLVLGFDALRTTATRVPAALSRRGVETTPRPRTNAKNVKKESPPTEAAPVIVLAEEAERKAAVARKPRAARARQEELHFAEEGRYQAPPTDLLDEPRHNAVRVDEEGLRKSSQILETKLADFGIEGRVVEVRPGPVITTFDIEPAPGVKVNRIVSLGDDLSMALRVPGVRILAPVPGKAVVGIEVANPKREEVLLRELLESESFSQMPSPIALALGKDTAGTPISGDLARMPHLLIAGATGSGKSVAINAMVMSVLYKAPPRDVRFVMIDLKMLELSVYEDIPHLLVPVVTDPKQAVVVLNNIVDQMEDRYRLMKQKGVRGIDGYNRLVEDELTDRGTKIIELNELADDGSTDQPAVPLAPPRPERLPKIVVIIDELADLMMTMGRKVEEPITRLAQKARAAGIHLIVATQRPSVDVITGLIKANFPARVSFQTTARVDSRTILDSIGAERLLGRGDMLYMPPGTARLQRLHGPLVTEAEIHRVVDYIKKQGSPQYVFSLLEGPEEEGEEGLEEDLDDELYDQAVRLVTESRQASISWVQRRLRVGYNRAARMIERMERDGVVSAGDGGRQREVLAQRIASD